MIQTSCSELLVDTKIHDPEEALEAFRKLFKACGFESSPPLTVKILEALKDKDESDRLNVMVFDGSGNRCFLEYGNNGYIAELGFRFDSHCNDYDTRCYPIFKEVIARLNGELISCDGGHTSGYEDWESGKANDDDEA